MLKLHIKISFKTQEALSKWRTMNKKKIRKVNINLKTNKKGVILDNLVSNFKMLIR
jgi:hypothetical protein